MDNIKQPVVLHRVDAPEANDGSQDARYYYELDHDAQRVIYYPSWTSVLSSQMPIGFGLLKWIANLGWDESQRQKKLAAQYGTLMHIVFQRILLGETITLPIELDAIIADYARSNALDVATLHALWYNDLCNDTLALIAWIADKQVKVLATEMTLRSSRHNVAGTIDLVCELTFNKKRVIAIVDFKSGHKGFYESNELQLLGYALTWNENFPELPVQMVFNWSPKEWTKEPTCNFVNQSEVLTSDGAREKLINYIANFKVDNPEVKPRMERSYNGVLSATADVSKLYTVIDFDAHVKQLHFDTITEATTTLTDAAKEF